MYGYSVHISVTESEIHKWCGYLYNRNVSAHTTVQRVVPNLFFELFIRIITLCENSGSIHVVLSRSTLCLISLASVFRGNFAVDVW